MNAISLFSGCGGDTFGLEQAGFRVTAFNEFKKCAIQSHEANFPHSKLLKDPITKKTDITKYGTLLIYNLFLQCNTVR